MYYPYLRGKQFELLAIKEMAQDATLRRAVHPVFEPIKNISGGLQRVLQALGVSRVACTVIINPQVGSLSESERPEVEILELLSDQEDGLANISIGVLVTPSTELGAVLDLVNQRAGPALPLCLFHLGHNDGLVQQLNAFPRLDKITHFVESKDILRRYRTELTSHPELKARWAGMASVKWQDHFQRRQRNLDYVPEPASLFSDDNIYFGDDGFVGFSDYQTIGSYYSDGGGLPRAVVLHWTYQTAPAGPIYISHFASDSNIDSSDIAGKFAEANKKLLAFAAKQNLDNPAISKMQTYQANGAFPGLGVLKKVSIQNHIYVVQKSLDEL